MAALLAVKTEVKGIARSSNTYRAQPECSGCRDVIQPWPKKKINGFQGALIREKGDVGINRQL